MSYNNTPDRWTDRRREAANNLFDFLADTMDRWVTRQEVADHLNMSPRSIDRVVRDVRILLGATDSITVAARTNPGGYKLVGTYEDAREWVTGRLSDAEVRLESIRYSMQALVTGTDGRTMDGKKARLIEMTTRHLVEQLQAMDAD